MSSLKERLAQDFKTALKEKDTVRKNVIQLIRAGILQVEKDTHTELDDTAVMSVIQKEQKKRQETIHELRGQRPDMIEALEAELGIIEAYLPEPLSDEALDALIQESIAATGATSMKDMGRVMQDLMPKVQGQADGKVVNQRLRSRLTS